MPDRQKIAVLGGTGAEGSGIALRLLMAGHDVTIGSRDPDKAARVADELASLARTGINTGCATGKTLIDAALDAEIVILTVPYAAQRDTATTVRDALNGKILIDATAPLVPPQVARVQLPEGGSAVAAIQKFLGPEVRVVSAFQNVAAHHLRDLDHEVDCDVLVCGDDVAARETVIALIRGMGLRALHGGPLCNSAATEALTSVIIAINRRYKIPGGAGLRITGLEKISGDDAGRS
jgi:NADPH-dependent F420 reductase